MSAERGNISLASLGPAPVGVAVLVKSALLNPEAVQTITGLLALIAYSVFPSRCTVANSQGASVWGGWSAMGLPLPKVTSKTDSKGPLTIKRKAWFLLVRSASRNANMKELVKDSP